MLVSSKTPSSAYRVGRPRPGVELREFVVEGVSKGFLSGGDWMPVLNDVSLDLEPGEVGAIIGRRLGGKTTLLRIAAGMQRPDEGIVSLRGQKLAGLSDKRMARLRGDTIVWLDREDAEKEREREVSRFVGLPFAIHGRKHVDRVAAQSLERVGARRLRGPQDGLAIQLAARVGGTCARVRRKP